MKKLLIALLGFAMLGMVACNDKNAPSGPGQQEEQKDTTTVTIPEGVDIPAEAITVAQAREICAKLESGATTETKYYVKGWVKKLHSKHESGVTDYGNGSFYMVDKTGDSDDFLAFQVYGLNGQKLTSVDQVAVGDYVVVYGELTNYNGTYETVGKGAAYIYSSSNPKIKEGGEQQQQGPVDNYTYVTIAEALEIGKALAKDAETPDYYMDTVIIKAVKTAAENVPGKYNNINMTVKDATGEMDSYYTNYLDNAPFTSADQIPPVNSKVIVIAKIANYKGTTVEFKNGYIAKILEEGDGQPSGGEELEGDVVFLPTSKAMPEAWSMILNGEAKDASDKDFYSDFSFKLDKLNKGVQSPEFEGAEEVKVSFVISKLNAKQNATEQTDGTIDVIGLDEEGNAVATVAVEGVNAADTYTADLKSETPIVSVRVILTQFPFNGEAQCNAALKQVSVATQIAIEE
ncbi:MAG: hypothetical protein K5660_02575 [Paludibacteraceae bacterium]|nr:hypothetical protein [Paludibacteraceae bacterium]